MVGDGPADEVVRSGGGGLELPDDFIRFFFGLGILELFNLLVITFFDHAILAGQGSGDGNWEGYQKPSGRVKRNSSNLYPGSSSRQSYRSISLPWRLGLD
jgi:hypothetical protein